MTVVSLVSGTGYDWQSSVSGAYDMTTAIVCGLIVGVYYGVAERSLYLALSSGLLTGIVSLFCL